MNRARTLSIKNLAGFDFVKTKKNVGHYFMNLEKLQWEYEKLNAQKGLTADYDFSVDYKKQPYMQITKDAFNLSAKELKEEELQQYISGFYWAKVSCQTKNKYTSVNISSMVNMKMKSLICWDLIPSTAGSSDN